jgi:cytochrome P450
MPMADHARLRGLVHKAFTPRMIERMQARVETLAQELITRGQQRGRLDLIANYALPIPLTVISEMMGIAPKFHRWVKYVLEKLGRANPIVYVPQALLIARLLRGEIRRRRTHPTDDLITALVQAEEAGNRLTEDELLSMIFIMLVAGFETTVNLIGSGTLALIEHPDQLDLLRRHPALIKSAVEELLRFTSPVELATERYAMEDITMHGVTIPKGELVMVAIGSANRDERQFENPDTLDIIRANNKHIAFGLGVHYCVGAPLARLEGSIAINTLVHCLPDLRLAVAPDALRWRPGYQVRGLESLPVMV